ncbi:hypothetical protein CEXT_149411 [Caerostris extrusa]|uniref:Uncharacterized protein n=1 Tax=Caerostris extrusa TaxID=172846 RepID=A0AAV4XTM0_CAEEX|nr:hypothetical protein CEXT_149411 [Caerostris extrusa]
MNRFAWRNSSELSTQKRLSRLYAVLRCHVIVTTAVSPAFFSKRVEVCDLAACVEWILSHGIYQTKNISHQVPDALKKEFQMSVEDSRCL